MDSPRFDLPPKRISRYVTQAQANFLDFIEELQFCEFETMTVMKGDPVSWTKAVQKGRFDLTRKPKTSTVKDESPIKP